MRLHYGRILKLNTNLTCFVTCCVLYNIAMKDDYNDDVDNHDDGNPIP